MTRQGLPTATTPEGIECVTTLPAPIVVPFPTVTPGRITLRPPIPTSSPMTTGAVDEFQKAAFSFRRSAGFVGWKTV